MKKLCLYVVSAALVLAGLLFSLPCSVFAGETEVHGYGYQGYLKSPKNDYLDARDSTYAFNKIALLFSNRVEDNTSVWVQIFGDSEKIGLDWAYVDYRFTNSLELRAGQIKFPIGLINEARDNKLLHLAMMEPIMYREEADVVFEAYRGAGLNYSGPLTVDVFGGAPVSESDNPLVKNEAKELTGGRITYMPVEGLKLMASFAGNKEEIISSDPAVSSIPEGKERVWIASMSYDNHSFEVNAEYAKNKLIEGSFKSYYVEAGYTFFDKLTPFVRYDYIVSADEGVDTSDPAMYQKETVVGVGYKVNPYFAIKAEQHLIDGYLLSVATGETAAGFGEKKWDMFVAGINFMF